MILGSGVTLGKYLQGISRQAMSESKLVELLMASGNIEPSKNSNSIITSDILKELNEYNHSNSENENIIGLNYGILGDIGNKLEVGIFNHTYSNKGLEKRALKAINYKK